MIIVIYKPGFDGQLDRQLIKGAKSSCNMAQAVEGVAAHHGPVVCSKLQADLLRIG